MVFQQPLNKVDSSCHRSGPNILEKTSKVKHF